jgi:hypothetical protein
MFLKGGEVDVSCDVLATEVIEDLLPPGVFAPGERSSSPDTGRAAIRQIGGCSEESVPFDGDALLCGTRPLEDATSAGQGVTGGEGGETAPAARAGAASTGR